MNPENSAHVFPARVSIRRLNPEEIIPHGAFHSVDDARLMPMMNPEETVGQKAGEFTRRFYVVESIVLST